MIKKYFHILRRGLAKLWLEVNLQLTVVGVTGSYGKTSTVYAVSEVLKAKYSVNKTDLNLDTVYNLPITVLKTKIWNEVLVLEYGVDHFGEMEQHLSLVKPKIAVLTGITPVHAAEGLMGSLENIISEKRKLVDAIPENGLAVFNYDDEQVRAIGAGFQKRKIFYGLNSKADIWADKIKIDINGTNFTLHSSGQNYLVKTGLLGYPAVYSCLAAFAVGVELRVEPAKIVEKLESLRPLSGRFSIEQGPLGTTLISDFKRSNPASATAGLKSFGEFPGRKVAVMGEMGELGKYSEEMHLKVGQEVAKNKIDNLVGVGPLTKNILQGAENQGMKKQNLFYAQDVVQAAEILKKVLKKGDLLYVKASLLRHLERIFLILEGQKVCCTEVVCHHYTSCKTCPLVFRGVK